MTHDTARKQGLDPVFPETHKWGQRIFYDPAQGDYYDSSCDLYLCGLTPLTLVFALESGEHERWQKRIEALRSSFPPGSQE